MPFSETAAPWLRLTRVERERDWRRCYRPSLRYFMLLQAVSEAYWELALQSVPWDAPGLSVQPDQLPEQASVTIRRPRVARRTPPCARVTFSRCLSPASQELFSRVWLCSCSVQIDIICILNNLFSTFCINFFSPSLPSLLLSRCMRKPTSVISV